MGRCVYAGIDEAGRGPVMGPLVVAGVACPDPDVLADLGVKDSKKVSPARRVRLDRLIRSTPGVRVAVRSLEAPDVDGQRARLSLNDIEVLMFQEIAVALAPRHIIVDAADVDAARFGRRIAMALPHGTTVHSEHKADDNHPVVAAASIVAKVHRDAAIGTLARRLERHMDLEMGSGYAHDPRTQAFLAAWLAAHGDLPEGTRRSWKPARTLMTLHQTPKLEAFAAVADAAGGHTKAPAADPQAPPPGTPRGHAPQARARSNPRRGRTPGATTP